MSTINELQDIIHDKCALLVEDFKDPYVICLSREAYAVFVYEYGYVGKYMTFIGPVKVIAGGFSDDEVAVYTEEQYNWFIETAEEILLGSHG